MIKIYPYAIQQSSSFATNAGVTLNTLNLPVTASSAGFSLNDVGPTGPTLTVNAEFVCGTC